MGTAATGGDCDKVNDEILRVIDVDCDEVHDEILCVIDINFSISVGHVNIYLIPPWYDRCQFLMFPWAAYLGVI